MPTAARRHQSEGKIKVMEVHDNGIGRDAKELLRKVRAARYVASHPGSVSGEVDARRDTLEPWLDLVGKIKGSTGPREGADPSVTDNVVDIYVQECGSAPCSMTI